ncbi:hypothetical protein AB0C02_09440 [Micromonospora sp. NPDC048999]|uniref:hypothetical protein n=1 Tax=Micromonospora sp. NPDC048999 TaxID=3155391 RepID=UPI00340EC828
MTDQRYVIQLPVAADDLATAVRVVARSLSFHGLVECDDAHVAAENNPEVRHPAFCPRRLGLGGLLVALLLAQRPPLSAPARP